MSVQVITKPTQEPIGLDDVKNHLNLLNNDHDTYLSGLIVAARRQCETITHQTAMSTTFEMSLRCFPPDGVIEIPSPPLQSVESITYTDTDGAAQTLASSEYVEKTDSMPGAVLRAYGSVWPSTRRSGVARPVVVRYVAGYASRDDVPQEFKQAMMLLIGHWWMVRESVAQVEFSEVPMSAKSLLSCVWHGDYP